MSGTTTTTTAAAAEPFFLKAGNGQRFCLYHPPHPGTRPAGALIYIHPFAEELNRSRRMVALQARALAAAGVAVLQIDLFGCGDSSGDLRDANWACWNNDVAIAWHWLEQRTQGPIGLWGLRLGALLALAFARESTQPVERLLLWQPVISGELFLTQFLRLRLASDLLLGLSKQPAGTREMRSALAAGDTLEVAGYELAPALAADIDSLKLAALGVADLPIHWFEIIPETGRPLPPAATHVANAWAAHGMQVHTHLVPGNQFWALPESAECAGLLSATTAIFA